MNSDMMEALAGLLVVVVLVGAAIGTFAGQAAASGHVHVAIDSTNSPVLEGETMTFDVTVTNNAESSATQEIDLFIGDMVRDSTEVTLAAGESRTVTLEWETSAGDAGEHFATVSSNDDSDSRNVLVELSPEFDVTIDGIDSPVVEGETLTVDATIENVGEATDTQEIVLRIDGTERDSTGVTLDPGETRSVTLEWATGSGDAGSYNAEVASPDDAAVSDVTVRSAAEFEVTLDGTNSPVTEGETVVVDATVENVGGARDTQSVTLDVDGSREDATGVTLFVGESTDVTLTWSTASGDAGTPSFTVATSDDAATGDVTVTSEETPTPTPAVTPTPTATSEPTATDDGASGEANPAARTGDTAIEVRDVTVEDEVAPGQSAAVTVALENEGDDDGSRRITLGVDGDVVDSQDAFVEAGANVTIGFDPTFEDEGEYDVTVEGEPAGTVTVSAASTPGEGGANQSGSQPGDDPSSGGIGFLFGVAVVLLAVVSIAVWARTQDW